MLNFTGEIATRWREFSPAPLQGIQLLDGSSSLKILRLDLITSWATGNKYFKLKYVLHEALTSGIERIVSKGGMFSNHLAALSEACLAFNIHLVTVIRSHVRDEMNPSIQRLRAHEHEILYLPPSDYKSFDSGDAERLFPGSLFIPEGGLSTAGIKGTSEIMQSCLECNPSHIIVAGGTMGTACGIVAAAPASVKVIIVPAWKGCTYSYFTEILNKFEVHPACTWDIWPDYHFGGFGKFNHDLIEFMIQFTRDTGIPLDPVYNGKVMYAIDDKMRSGFFNDNDSILVLHTGGMQGLAGFKYRFPEEWGRYQP